MGQKGEALNKITGKFTKEVTLSYGHVTMWNYSVTSAALGRGDEEEREEGKRKEPPY